MCEYANLTHAFCSSTAYQRVSMNPHVNTLVGGLVCHSFNKKGREVTLPMLLRERLFSYALCSNRILLALDADKHLCSEMMSTQHNCGISWISNLFIHLLSAYSTKVYHQGFSKGKRKFLATGILGALQMSMSECQFVRLSVLTVSPRTAYRSS